MSSNNAWFEQNCDPSDVDQQEEQVASGGGPVGAPDGSPSPNTVAAVLEDLIGQCYGTQTIQRPNFKDPEIDDDISEWEIDWGFLLDELIGHGWPVPEMDKLRYKIPRVGDPGGGDVCFGENGEEISCDKEKNPDLEDCIKNHLDCLFKPYVGGAWKPPKADCDSFVPKSMYGTTKKICVADCVQERVGIYEHILGDTPTATATFSDKDTITVSGSGTCLLTLEHRWKDQQWTAGTAVDTIAVGGATFTRSGTRGKTTQTVALTAGTYAITYTGLHPTGGYNIEANAEYGSNKTIVFRDGHGSDVNGRFSILSSNIASDHAYSLTSQQYKAGYSVQGTGPMFYAHTVQQSRGSVPVYRSYSSIQPDTMLTTDPVGEKATMDAQGFGARDEILFYGFIDKQDMISELMDGESPVALYRYYSPESKDHMYTITPIGGIPIEANLEEGYYQLTTKAETYLNFTFNCRQGSASYDNTMGFYLCNANDEPVHGRVILENATDASGTYTYKVPADELNQYIPCKLGFFMIPDGQGRGTSHGDAVTFSPLNDGWRVDQSTSAQSNYTFFSQKHLNSGDKDMTKWPDRTWQYWEDLLNGDDDYDDMKQSYHLRYGDSEYLYEGIQCYVFSKGANPVYEDITSIDKCEDRIFDDQFDNVAMTMTECGRVDAENDYGCATCTGTVAFSSNTVQNVTALKSGDLEIRSHGGMTGGWGDCTKFTWSLWKNGVQIHSKQEDVGKWKKIGTPLLSFSVVKDDRITWKLDSIDTGHYNGRVTPAMSLRDATTKKFLNTWEMLLITQSGTYRNANPAQNDGNLGSQEPTEPCGLPVSLQLFNFEDDGDDDITKENYTNVLVSKVVQNNTLQIRGANQASEVKVIGRKPVKDMSDGDTGYINTSADNGLSIKLQWTVHDAEAEETDWKLTSVLDWGQGGFDLNDEGKIFVGKYPDDDDTNYGSFYLGYKVNAINDIECPASSSTQGRIQDIALQSTHERDQSTPRQLNILVVDQQVIQNTEFVMNMDSIFSSFFRYKTGKAESFHQYYLQQSLLGNDVFFYTDYRDEKGLHFRLRIRVTRQDYYVNGDTYKFRKYGWFGNIKLSSVFNYGKRYPEGQAMQIQWPPQQLQYTNGKEPQSPYYPKQTNLPKKVQVRDATNARFTRNARYAIYQSMHDKNSQVWYSNQNSYIPTQQRWIDILAKEVD